MANAKVFGIVRFFCAVVFLVFVLAAGSRAEVLAELTAVSKGDMAAIQLNQYAPVAWNTIMVQYDVFIFAFFEKTSAKVNIEIYGIKTKVEEVQLIMETFRNLITGDFVPFFKTAYGIEINKLTELYLVYRNRSEEGRKKILVWEDGKYKFPLEK